MARSEGRHPLWRAGILLASLMGLAGGSIVRGEPGGAPRVITLELFEAIQPVTAQYVKQALQQADRANCALVILSLDTPGGLVLSTQELVKAITGSKVPVVVFVSGSHAASAGFFITLAADVAVMAPGTRFGAAHPVHIRHPLQPQHAFPLGLLKETALASCSGC